MTVTGSDGLHRTEAFRRTRARFHRFDGAIAGRRVSDQGIEQMVCSMSDILDSAVKSCLVCLGRFSETAQLPDELKRRCANFILRRGRTEVMKCFDGSAHVRTINTSRPTINYFVVRTSRNAGYFAMQMFLGSVKNLSASSPPSRPTPLCFIPPKGTRRSRTSQQFTQTVPVLIRSATR